MKYKKELSSFPEDAQTIYRISDDDFEIKEYEKNIFSELETGDGVHFFKSKHDAAQALIFNIVNDKSKELMDMEFKAQEYEDKADEIREQAVKLKEYIRVLSAVLPEDIDELVE